MKRNILNAALVLGLSLSLGVPAVYAAGRATKDQAKTETGMSGQAGKADVSKFKDDLRKEAKLSQQEIQNIESELQNLSQQNVSSDQITGLAKTAKQNNCTGPCLKDSLQAMNNAISKGFSGNEAQDVVASTLREEVQKSGPSVSGEELGSRIRAQVDQKVASRSGTMGAPGAPSPGTTPGTSPMTPESGGDMSGRPGAEAPGAAGGGTTSGGAGSYGR